MVKLPHLQNSMAESLVVCYPMCQISAHHTLTDYLKGILHHFNMILRDVAWVSCLLAALSDTGITLKVCLMLVLFQIDKAILMQLPLNLVRILAVITWTLRGQMYNIHDITWVVPIVHASPPNNCNVKTNFKSSSKAKLPRKEINVRSKNDVHVTHSAHMSKPTARLITSM